MAASISGIGFPAVLRAAAMDALRAIPSPQVEPRLLAALASDPEPKVRLEAAFALGFRSPTAELFAAEAKALAADTDEQVRAALLDDLGKLAPQFPQALTLIRDSADKDPSESVRRSAQGLVQALGAAAAP